MKNNFLKATFILLIGGMFTKIIGFIVRIIYMRIIGEDGIGLFSLVMPTYSLLMSLANFNIQLAVSKRISAGNDSKKTVFNACYIMLLLDIVLILIMFFSSKFISLYLLKNSDSFYPLLACSLTLPFISIGYVVKGYFYGKQNMLPHMVSNVLEQLFRLVIISLLLKHFVKYGTIILVTVLILFNILSETFSMIIFMFFLPKKIKIKKEDLVYQKEVKNDLMSVCVPSISGRLIGNIGYFFEPIILTNVLSMNGFSSKYIVREYGIYNSYSISLLLFPSFFISAISNSLLPEISKFYQNKKYSLIKKRLVQAILLSLVVGVCATSFIYFSRDFLLFKLYNTTNGSEYIKLLAPFFILYYLEAPLSTSLIALNKVKTCTFISTSGMIVKIITMICFGFCGFGINSLIYAEIINILYVTLLDFTFLRRVFNNI